MTQEPRETSAPLVEMRNMSVSFGGVHAVKDVTIDLHEGETLVETPRPSRTVQAPTAARRAARSAACSDTSSWPASVRRT